MNEEWDSYEQWACGCRKHTFSNTYVRYMQERDTTCDKCGTPPVQFQRVTYRRRSA